MTSHNFGAMLSLQTLAHVGKVGGKFVVYFSSYPWVTSEDEFPDVQSTEMPRNDAGCRPVETWSRYEQQSYNIYKNR